METCLQSQLQVNQWYTLMTYKYDINIWRKFIIFNLKFITVNDTGNFFVILECCSDPEDVEFNCKLSASVVKSPCSVNKTGELLKNKLMEASNWGLMLMPSRSLLENNSGLCPDGTLHLRITIRAINLIQKHDPDTAATIDSLIELLNLNANSNDSSADDSFFDVVTATSESNVLIKTQDRRWNGYEGSQICSE